jgi:hypothetical protein
MDVPLADSYRPAMLFAVGTQLVCSLLSAMVLDGGNAFTLCLCTFFGFWVGASIVILRHPRDPSDMDLWAIRYGFFPLYVLSFVIMGVLLSWNEHHQP